MAKPTAPLLAFSARGTIAKTAVYSSWRGVPYVRRWTVPSNPRSPDQTLTRMTFSWLTATWTRAPALFQEPWTAFALGQPFTNRNAFNQKNIGPLREETDLVNMILSPGAKGGLACTSAVATPGSGQLSVAIAAPTPPVGWSIVEAVACAILDQDPQSDTAYTITAGFDATSAYVVVLTGLSAALYRGAAWLKWTKPDGSFAYGPGLNFSGTPS